MENGKSPRMEETKRKGARTPKDVPPEVLERLNRGEIEAVNLMESLAMDQRTLLGNLLRQTGRTDYLQPVLDALGGQKKQGFNSLAETIGTALFAQVAQRDDQDFLSAISAHRSDLVRCWAAYGIGRNPDPEIEEALERIRPFAADGHYGVREIAWMAVRPKLARDLERSIRILSGWAMDKDANIRRFASEATRPRGVWCAHIEALKDDPGRGLPILEPLRADTSKYVRDSVGNWLNDAGKTRPDVVKAICARWETESGAKETKYIVRRAMRTMKT